MIGVVSVWCLNERFRARQRYGCTRVDLPRVGPKVQECRVEAQERRVEEIGIRVNVKCGTY